MKHQILILLSLTAVLVCSKAALSQDAERKIQYSQLDNFLDYLSSNGMNEVDEMIKRTEELMAICPSLGGIVKQFKVKKNESTNRINERLQRRSQLDLSVQVIQVDGVVESQTKGCLVINSNSSFVAVKGNAPIGSTYKAYVKRGDGTISYKPLGGSSQTLPIYVAVSGASPQEQHAALGKEVDELQNRYSDLWEKFKTDCSREVLAQREKLKQVLLNDHYALGEDLLAKKEYDSALREFNYVKSLDASFRDIATKLELSNNKNHVVKQSDVYRILTSKPNYFLIGTSRGVFASSDTGRTWKAKAFEGRSVHHFDALENKIVLYDETDGIFQYSADAGKTWKRLAVWYNAESYPGKTKLTIFQPRFEIEKLRLIPSKTTSGCLIFIKYVGREGQYKTNNQVIQVEKGSFGGFQYWINNRNDFFDVPQKVLSPDGGNNWVGFWKALWANAFYAGVGSRNEINDWIDTSMDYSEDPENAVDNVVNFIVERKKFTKDQIKVLASSAVRQVKKDDNVGVLVLTNYGLFKTCWDCDQVDEIAYSSQDKIPLSVLSDIDAPNLIMIGFQGNGLIISRDGGRTWEGI